MQDVRQLLTSLRGRYNQRQLAEAIGISVRTLRRWEIAESDPPPYAADAIRQRLLPLADFARNEDCDFRFIDLFAGIGGIRMAFEAHGGHCVFTSEWNPYAQKTYLANFPEAVHALEGDITMVDARDIPDHDVLLAGFPCQPFSIAGVSKKNALGRAHGFADETQGTLFFDVARIIAEKRPAAFLLENVKNLISHDKGNTFRIIQKVLTEKLGYHIEFKVVDGAHFVPQHRERILIAGFREKTDFSFDDLMLPRHKPNMKAVLHPQDGSEEPEAHYTVGPKARVDDRYTLTPKLWTYLQAYAAKHRAAGNGFGFGLVTGESVARTLSARYYKDGSEILVSQGPRKRPRRLTPRECARLMGFPDDFVIPVSDTQAYKLFADASVVPMVAAIAKCMTQKLKAAETMNEIRKPREGAFASKGNWTREQTILAFHFYCQTPFGQLHAKNKKIVELAELIGRTPSALAMKCVNIASIDPAIRESGRAGLSNASSQDKEIWQEFHENWDGLIEQAEVLRTYLLRERGFPQSQEDSEVITPDFTGETRIALIKQRMKQAFFRRSVLSSYGGKCCISGVGDGRFLVASHIVAWKDDVSIRLNPANGLCLSTIHDRAFDSHLFSLTDDHRIILSKPLHDTKDQFLREIFLKMDGTRISLPERFVPSPEYLARHRNLMQALQG